MTIIHTNGSKNKYHAQIALPDLTGYIPKGASWQDLIWNVFTTSWSLYNLRQTFQKIDTSSREITHIQTFRRRPVELIALNRRQQNNLSRTELREMRAHKEFIRRCYYKVFHFGVQIMKVSLIFVNNHSLKKGVQGAMNTLSHSSLIVRELTTRTREQLFTPEDATWKDQAHKTFLITLNVSNFAVGVFNFYSSTYMDENDPNYKWIQNVSLATAISGIAYGGLQFLGVFSNRD